MRGQGVLTSRLSTDASAVRGLVGDRLGTMFTLVASLVCLLSHTRSTLSRLLPHVFNRPNCGVALVKVAGLVVALFYCWRIALVVLSIFPVIAAGMCRPPSPPAVGVTNPPVLEIRHPRHTRRVDANEADDGHWRGERVRGLWQVCRAERGERAHGHLPRPRQDVPRPVPPTARGPVPPHLPCRPNPGRGSRVRARVHNLGGHARYDSASAKQRLWV